MTISTFPSRIGVFLNEVRAEIKKVNWPTKKETLNHTIIVVGVCLVVAVILGGFDFLISFLFNRFIFNNSSF